MGAIMPDSWHESRVAALFKKTNLCDYRSHKPISSICSAYKLFAMILIQRLKDTGTE